MPAQRKTSKFDKFGSFRQTMDRYSKDPISYGIVNLPPGVNGVAVLTDCYVKENKDGVPFWRAEGTIQTPETFTVPGTGETMTLRGLTTQVIVYTGNTPEEHAEAGKKIQEEMRKLAGDDFLSDNDGLSVEELSELLLKWDPPIRFRFSTSLGKVQIDPKTGKPKVDPNTGKPYEPRVWQNWHGTRGLSSAGQDASPAFEDGTAAPPPPPANRGGDVENLLHRLFTLGDNDALKVLERLALANGWSSEEFTAEEDIERTRLMVTTRKPVEAETPAERVPVLGTTVLFGPPNPRKKGTFLPPIDCDVIAIDAKAKTVSLRPLSDPKKEFSEVPWDRLTHRD